MLFLKLVSFFILLHFSFEEDNSNIFCSKSFCKVYTTVNPCRKIPDACRAQNATHNGIFLPSDGPCNCCKYCLENLQNGEECEITATQSSPSAICGDGLSCQDGTKSSCQKLATLCTKEAKSWDNRRKTGTLGHMELRPECDKNGNYLPVKCIPGQTCFCQSEDGKRIFGEIPYEANAQIFMNCACSRHNNKANIYFKTNNYSFFRPRCLPDGSFDALQCFNSTCVCVDQNDGLANKTSKIHETLINQENVDCFDKSNHEVGEYYRSCEKEYKKLLDEIDSYKKDGIIFKGIRFPNCQDDGNYAPVQEDKYYKFCVDPKGITLKTPEGKDYKLVKSNPYAKIMDCKCARANLMIKGKEKATCIDNGNYNRIQRRRGLSRCVNSDGIQVVTNNQIEVEIKDEGTLRC